MQLGSPSKKSEDGSDGSDRDLQHDSVIADDGHGPFPAIFGFL
jgi:hypothetical protein